MLNRKIQTIFEQLEERVMRGHDRVKARLLFATEVECHYNEASNIKHSITGNMHIAIIDARAGAVGVMTAPVNNTYITLPHSDDELYLSLAHTVAAALKSGLTEYDNTHPVLNTTHALEIELNQLFN